MTRMLGEWVAEGVAVMGVRMEMVALLPQVVTLRGGDRDHGSGTANGPGGVRDGDALGASLCG